MKLEIVGYCPRKNKLYVYKYSQVKWHVTKKGSVTKRGLLDFIGVL